MRWIVGVGAILGILAWFSGCSSEDGSTSSNTSNASCVPGETNACVCTNGDPGSQLCGSNGTYGACSCAGATWPSLDGPEDPNATDPDADTSDLDPLPGGVGGEENPLSCLGYPAALFAVNQGNHQGGAIDLACSYGEGIANPFPAPAKVIQLTTEYSSNYCYDTVSDYNDECSSSEDPPSSDSSCNNKLVLQTTIAGVDWQITMLHISGSAYNAAASRDIEVGDVVGPFESVALCGNVGWVCPGPDNDGSHLHLVLKNLETGQTVYPEDMFEADCAGLQSGGGCSAGTTCCDANGEYAAAGEKSTGCDDTCHACNGGGGCYDTCGKSCLSGDGLYCGGSVGLEPGTLYSCTGGVYSVSAPCPNGCNVAGAGEPDSCKPGTTTVSCPSGEGVYCGATLGLDANKLYQCTNGTSTVLQTCANGCNVAPPGQPDACKSGSSGSCPSGDGLYCGATLGLDANKLYQCTHGTSTVVQTCSNGCTVAPPGQADACASAGGSCPSGDGLYCGSSVGKNANNLYNCVGGNITLAQQCPAGCSIAPPGQPDHCA